MQWVGSPFLNNHDENIFCGHGKNVLLFQKSQIINLHQGKKNTN